MLRIHHLHQYRNEEIEWVIKRTWRVTDTEAENPNGEKGRFHSNAKLVNCLEKLVPSCPRDFILASYIGHSGVDGRGQRGHVISHCGVWYKVWDNNFFLDIGWRKCGKDNSLIYYCDPFLCSPWILIVLYVNRHGLCHSRGLSGVYPVSTNAMKSANR